MSGVSIDSLLIMLDRIICWKAIGQEASQVVFIQVACPRQIEIDILLVPPMEDLLFYAFKLAFVEVFFIKRNNSNNKQIISAP